MTSHPPHTRKPQSGKKTPCAFFVEWRGSIRGRRNRHSSYTVGECYRNSHTHILSLVPEFFALASFFASRLLSCWGCSWGVEFAVEFDVNQCLRSVLDIESQSLMRRILRIIWCLFFLLLSIFQAALMLRRRRLRSLDGIRMSEIRLCISHEMMRFRFKFPL